MSAHVNPLTVAMIRQDEEDATWFENHLQWKYGYTPGQKQFAERMIKLLRERWAIDLIPASPSERTE